MPSDFPGSPKFLKGAFVVYESQTPGPPPKVVVFQYNPETLTRNLTKGAAAERPASIGASREEVLRVQAPPQETITNVIIHLDAADQLEEPEQNRITVEHGLHPVFATLELLLYPSVDWIIDTEIRAQRGEVQVGPGELPLTLLVWGQSRVVPVLLTSFAITESNFDQGLNPIQAVVTLGMRVLTNMELPRVSLGRDAYISYVIQKESLAQRFQSAGDQIRRVSGLLPN